MSHKWFGFRVKDITSIHSGPRHFGRDRDKGTTHVCGQGSRDTVASSIVADGLSLNSGEPKVVGKPLTSMRSLTPIGRPCSTG
jgi:hypothetical protein